MTTPMPPIVAAVGLTAGYSNVPVVRSIDLEVAGGEIVALIGPNGMGKTTTIMTLAGCLTPISGDVLWNGSSTVASLEQRAREGLSLVTEERSIIGQLSVRDNLRVCGGDTATALDLFPALGKMLNRRASVLSGGEQQMLALALGLCRHPKAILIDELSLGLAPMIADRLADTLRTAAASGLGVLLVEQDLRRALRVSDRFYVMSYGAIAITGNSLDFVERTQDLHDYFVRGHEATSTRPVDVEAEKSAHALSRRSS